MFDYSKDRIGELIPAIWDSTSVLEERDPTSPDPDMPKAASDKSKSGGRVAECADIQRAWSGANLGHAHRVSLVTIYGLGGTVADVQRHLKVSYAQAALVNASAIEIVGEFLNGRAYPDYKQKDSEKDGNE